MTGTSNNGSDTNISALSNTRNLYRERDRDGLPAPGMYGSTLNRTDSVASSGVLSRMPASPPSGNRQLPGDPHFTPDSSHYSPTDPFSSRRQHRANDSTGTGSGAGSHRDMAYGGITTQPLRPPPVRDQDRERERQRERLRAEKERESENTTHGQERYSRPPPSYAPPAPEPRGRSNLAPAEDVDARSRSVSPAYALRHQPPPNRGASDRTGDIPIALGIRPSMENDSRTVNAPSQLRMHNLPDHGTLPRANNPQPLSVVIPGAVPVNVAALRSMTPEIQTRSYTPDRTMAVGGGGGERSYTPDMYAGRPSEDRVWTLDGVTTSRAVSERPRLGAPIMEDRERVRSGAWRP